MSTRPDFRQRSSTISSDEFIPQPFAVRNGRAFLRDADLPYPLPCDFPEINRQMLRTMLLMQVFGAPFCAPYLEYGEHKSVLEVACGSGAWSTACHDYFGKKSTIAFTGLDIVSLAPDLRRQGVRWHFVQHDLRKPPLPFPDQHFDFVFIKDTSFCTPAASLQGDPLSEPLRVLKPGGTLEIWDSDYIIRTLLPNPPIAPGTSKDELEHAERTATYSISAATPFTKAQNKYLQDYNLWAQKALERKKLTGVPCAFFSMALSTEAESFRHHGSRRIAIPLSEVRWEKETPPREETDSTAGLSGNSLPLESRKLNPNQLALRRTALITIVQLIEGLEPMLMDASGMTRDEWDRWWAGMTRDLLQQNGTASGECLEVGAWWAQKI